MSVKEHEIMTWKLLHPELLSQDELIELLRERHVKIDEKISQDKPQLVEMFKRIAMPQSQRSRFQSKPTQMEIDQPSSPCKLNSLSNEYQMRQSSRNQGAALEQKLDSSSNTSFVNTAHCQPTKIKLKRTACQMTESSSKGEPSPKKREKITWP